MSCCLDAAFLRVGLNIFFNFVSNGLTSFILHNRCDSFYCRKLMKKKEDAPTGAPNQNPGRPARNFEQAGSNPTSAHGEADDV